VLERDPALSYRQNRTFRITAKAMKSQRAFELRKARSDPRPRVLYGHEIVLKEFDPPTGTVADEGFTSEGEATDSVLGGELILELLGALVGNATRVVGVERMDVD
jgi:hypothetical protein